MENIVLRMSHSLDQDFEKAQKGGLKTYGGKPFDAHSYSVSCVGRETGILEGDKN